MKKLSKLIGMAFLFALLSSSLNSNADRCEDLCLPQENGTCGLLEDGGVLICGNSTEWEELEPIDP